MSDLLPSENLGVKPPKESLLNFQAEGVTGITYQINKPSGNWLPSSPQAQSGKFGDKLNCVTYGFHHPLEIQLNWQIGTNTLPEKQLKFLKDNGYIDDKGSVNFNERIAAILNGTDSTGNDFITVAQSAKNYGLFPETLLANDSNLSWGDYYGVKITESMLDVGREFKKLFQTPYEMVLSNPSATMTDATVALIQKHLLQAPLQIAAPWCPGFGSDNPVKACSQTAPQHSTALIGYGDTTFTDFDQYAPFIRHLNKNYPIPYIMKTLILPIDTNVFKHLFFKELAEGDMEEEVKYLQIALRKLGYFHDSMEEKFYGYFGNITLDAVKAFQKAKGIRTTGVVGIKTNTALNKIFNV